MDWFQQCAVVIPCLNEAASIASVVAQARAYLRTVVVVDDGSSDKTSAVAAASGATVLRHKSPRGKGSALKTGLNWLFTRRFHWALTMDGDGQHLGGDIPAFFTRAEATQASLIVGNRMPDSLRMPWLRRQVNQWMSARLSAWAGQPLPDSQCGFRLFDLQIWSSLDLRTAHFETESELLLAFLSAGQPVEFVPIQVIYRHESSKVRPAQDAWRWLKWWWRTCRSERALPNVERPKHFSEFEKQP